MRYRKKLIEVALPLEAINVESAREKSIRHGHPSTLHLWWARRPLAACRAVIFASLVDDPSALPEKFPTEEAQEAERQRLFRIIEQLILWENSTNQTVLNAARAEIMRCTAGNPPPLLDPFCGGGSIPLEAQRLGLEAHASDLNPVAVLITKALIEIPPKFAGKPPVNPESCAKMGAGHGWSSARGLAEDVRYYGKWMRDEADRRIGHLYLKVTLPKEHGGGEATVIAWLWARTVPCPNPACRAQMPLVRSFWLSTKPGNKAWVVPIVDRLTKTVSFEVKTDSGTAPDGTVNRQGAVCIVCNTPVPFTHIRSEGSSGHMSQRLMAMVVQGQRERIYLCPDEDQVLASERAEPWWKPDGELPKKHRNFQTPAYGMPNLGDLFTRRQLVALTTISDLISEARDCARQDAVDAGFGDDDTCLAEHGTGATAYADSVATYLAFGLDKNTLTNCTIATWQTDPDRLTQAFSRQALPMTWDFAEANPLSDAGGGFALTLQSLAEVLSKLPAQSRQGVVTQQDITRVSYGKPYVISTDPPYYDNINYADLSDFFYVWLRRSLGKVYPSLFATLLVPKAQELVAAPHRFGGDKDDARRFFEDGLGTAFSRMRAGQSPDYPLTIYYAFKQSETEGDDNGNHPSSAAVASTGWETMLEGLIKANLTITGTWPMRTELITSLKRNMGALASSVLLVCRARPDDSPVTSRRDFLNALKRELPDALKRLQHGNIAPVDLAQATIGPGMAVFSRYGKVLEADGSAMRVRTALQLINQALDEVLTEQEGEFDADTRWAVAWFDQFGMQEGLFGQAETLSKAKNTSVSGLQEAGLLVARQGKVRLLRRDELPANWDPSADKRLTVWEVTQHLIRALDREGETGAATLLRRVGAVGEVARDLAYRLYTVCERKKWADEALAYNSLVIAWPRITQLASQQPDATPQQRPLF